MSQKSVKEIPAGGNILEVSDLKVHFPIHGGLLLRKVGDVKAQIIGLETMGGTSMTPADLEWVLKGVGAVKSTMERNPRARDFSGRSVQLGFVGNDADEE